MLYLVSAQNAHKPRRQPWISNATHGVASKQQPMQPTQEQEARHSAAPLLAACRFLDLQADITSNIKKRYEACESGTIYDAVPRKGSRYAAGKAHFSPCIGQIWAIRQMRICFE